VTIAAARGPASPPGWFERLDQPVGLLSYHGSEPLPHLGQAERRREWRAVPVVLRPLHGQHARPDDAAGREARVVDGERLRVAHRREREVAPRDEPTAERGHPRHRVVLAKPRQRGVGVARKVLERDRRAEGEAHSPSCVPRISFMICRGG
jgi:hypothetical protein